MCYLVNDKYLFTGDTTALENGKVKPFNKFFNMDTDEEIKSLDKIQNMDRVELILTGHYGYTKYNNAF
jgi:glyoxylase-like metal-dependent hydrolase (beta-lactamase superfamily II)